MTDAVSLCLAKKRVAHRVLSEDRRSSANVGRITMPRDRDQKISRPQFEKIPLASSFTFLMRLFDV